MLDSKRMYSTYFKEYILDDAMLKRLQDELLKITEEQGQDAAMAP